MNIQVIREACCAADDQLGPLDASYEITPETSLAELVERIVQSRFLQFSSTHHHLCGESNGRLLVEVHAPGGPPPTFHVPASERVSALIGEQPLFFDFRHVGR